MNTPIEEALVVLVVGMLSVFLILGLVVLSGRLLIHLVNRFTKEMPEQVQPSIPKEKIAAIVTAVDMVTQGRGKVTHIEEV